MSLDAKNNSQHEIIRKAVEKFHTSGSLPEKLEGDPRKKMLAVVQELYSEKLMTSTGGNISTRSGDEKSVWITPSKMPKGKLKKDMFVLIDLHGNKVDHNPYQPSSEKFVHTEIYRSRSDVNAVVHAHALYATALALCELEFLPISTEAAILKEIPRIGFVLPGTMELARTVVQSMGSRPAVLMQNHGVVVAASSLRKAVNILEVIERTSQLILTCYSAGLKPATLPEDVVDILHEYLEAIS